VEALPIKFFRSWAKLPSPFKEPSHKLLHEVGVPSDPTQALIGHDSDASVTPTTAIKRVRIPLSGGINHPGNPTIDSPSAGSEKMIFG
jgi:hypothetical protein